MSMKTDIDFLIRVAHDKASSDKQLDAAFDLLIRQRDRVAKAVKAITAQRLERNEAEIKRLRKDLSA